MMPRRLWTGGAALLLLATGLLTGCSDSSRARNEVVVPAGPTRSATPSAGPTKAAAPEPTLIDWGINGQMLSTVIRNDSPELIRSARVKVSVYDEDGHLLLSSLGSTRSKCCTVLGLPPGKTFGLFLTSSLQPDRIGRVEVEYTDLDAVPWSAVKNPPKLQAHSGRLTLTADDAIVDAIVKVDNPRSPYLAAQAFLVDQNGHLTAVISGRFYCYANGTSRHIRMRLTHPAPAGTRLQQVVVRSIPNDVDPEIPQKCKP